MLGAEGVAASLLATFQASLPAKLAAVRTATGASATELPDPREWQDFEESRGTWDQTRCPLVQIVARQAGTPKRESFDYTSDGWAFEYQVQILVVLHAGLKSGWRSADRARKRYVLALRDLLLALPEDGAIEVLFGTLTERYYSPTATANGETVQADAVVQFTVRAHETVARTVAGTAERIELFLVETAVDEPFPVDAPDPLPDPITVP
jgi:hypothetical protein